MVPVLVNALLAVFLLLAAWRLYVLSKEARDAKAEAQAAAEERDRLSENVGIRVFPVTVKSVAHVKIRPVKGGGDKTETDATDISMESDSLSASLINSATGPATSYVLVGGGLYIVALPADWTSDTPPPDGAALRVVRVNDTDAGRFPLNLKDTGVQKGDTLIATI